MKQIICMKWGTLYEADYVNKLYAMVRHFTSGDIRFVCLTDDTTDIRSEVECYDCPEIDTPSRHSGGYRKLTLFRSSSHLHGLSGRWLFLDLDIVITSKIDDLFTFAPDKSFVVMENAAQKGKNIGNTSCYRFDIGTDTYIYDNYMQRYNEVWQNYFNSQTYISRHIKEMTFFPEGWCLLFKVHCIPAWPMRFWREPMLPTGAKVIAFPGNPNPPEAAAGIWRVKIWHKKSYKYIRPARWIKEIWRQCDVGD